MPKACPLLLEGVNRDLGRGGMKYHNSSSAKVRLFKGLKMCVFWLKALQVGDGEGFPGDVHRFFASQVSPHAVWPSKERKKVGVFGLN